MKKLIIIAIVILFAAPALAWRPGDTHDSGYQNGYYEQQRDENYYRQSEQRREERRNEMERQRLKEKNERLKYENKRERDRRRHNEFYRESDPDHSDYYDY